MPNIIRIEINHAGARELLRSGGAVALLDNISARIARAAGQSGGAFGHEARAGSQRALGAVWAIDTEAKQLEAHDRVLTRAIDAGR